MKLLLKTVLIVSFCFISNANSEKVSFPRVGEMLKLDNPEKNPPDEIIGNIYYPNTNASKYPAVLVIHGTGGVGYRTKKIKDKFIENEIAVLEIDLFKSRKQSPSSKNRMELASYLPDVYGALAWMANNEKIDFNKIGLTGFSLGGALGLYLSIGAHPWAYGGYPWDNIYPKAIVAWYPVCVSFNKRFNQRINYLKKTEIQQSLPISNLKIIAPTKDNYEDNPKTECKKFVNNYYGKQIDEIVWLVDNGTHGFDGDPKKGTFKYRDIGKNITTTTSKKLGDEYREKTVNYFKSIFDNN